jgi:hypothetical protein
MPQIQRRAIYSQIRLRFPTGQPPQPNKSTSSSWRSQTFQLSKHCYCPLRQCIPRIDETVLISLVLLFFTLGLNSMLITHVHYIYLRWRLQMYPAPSSEDCSHAYLHQYDQSLISYWGRWRSARVDGVGVVTFSCSAHCCYVALTRWPVIAFSLFPFLFLLLHVFLNFSVPPLYRDISLWLNSVQLLHTINVL